ncbi:hypothetical protein ElyMa_003862200 [Elysia marginata]|uniref:Reverse transcriptase domain-containing protein n=1 Tax=Elysia marginata TaxID=1093978 RepID=A0AAV4FKG0_9GAST|nr:hypothetical protein ElyMa_003862200 [Elysia marginata]
MISGRLFHVQFLLSKTTLDVKVNGTNTTQLFTTNVGTPQGDSLSAVLFIIYLENALRNARSNETPQQVLPNEIIYADDIDLVGTDPTNIYDIETSLKNFRLKVIVDKTEHTELRLETNQESRVTSRQQRRNRSQEILIKQLRWRLFGHILRRGNPIPANLAMLDYFNENSNRGRGRPTTTLPITLNNDLKRLQNKDVQLTTKEDLHKLQKIASQKTGVDRFHRGNKEDSRSCEAG